MQGKLIHNEHLHERERGKYLGDWVYGANDGIITTFAVVSGATGALFSPGVIITLGLANLIADGISMGLSNYLAIRSRLDYENRERRHERKEIEEFPAEEREEVRKILANRWKIPETAIPSIITAITADKKLWIEFMMREELGIIEDGDGSPVRHALATIIAFILAGSLPLLPFLFGVPAESAFTVSLTATAMSLFVVGSLRTLITKNNWFYSGLQMLGVGVLAAAAAYYIGDLVKNFLI